jgi:Tol biopolymer transport system component
MKKSLSYLALVGIVASFGAGAVGSAPASAATLSNATRLVLDTTGGDPNGGVGEAGVGDAGGVSTTLTASGTRWTVFESLSSDLVTGDTNGASDVFVTDGTAVTRLSVSADGTEGGSGLNSYDPEICSTGRKVAYVTENEFDIADANGAPDVYVIDRDADENGIFDEFSTANAVTVTSVSISYDTELEENVITSNGAYSPRFSSDCTKIAFVTDEYFNVDDLNFGPDVYMNTLGSVASPAVWVSAFADGGGEGGGYLPAINADGTKVTFVTEALDVVFSGGTLGGLIVSTVGASSVTSAAYASVRPNGNPSTGLVDTEYAPAISADGNCIAFKSNYGRDLLAGDTGPAEGIFLWDNRGSSPVISLVSKITTGQAATSATAPRITDDCSFIAYESNDEFISASDRNNRLDVFLYDIAEGTTQLISSNADGDSADANSSLAALDYDPTTGLGVVMITSGASNIRGVAGGNADLDVFSVPFTVESDPEPNVGGLTALGSPVRLLNTRTSGTKVGALDGNGAAYELTVAGQSGIPASDVVAVAMNVTVVDAEAGNAGGYVTVYPCGTRPDSSNLNFVNGQTVPNAVIAPVSSAGKVCFYVYGKAHLLADVSGYFTAGFTSLSAPTRLLNTRTSGVKVGKTDGTGTAYELTVAGQSGLPAAGSLSTVAMNVTVVDGEANDAGGYVTVYPCGTRPDSSNLNFVNGQTVPNAVIASVSSEGKVCFYVYGKAHLLADVSGYFDNSLTALAAPVRLLNTRTSGIKVGKTDGTGVAYDLTVAGASGLPGSGITSVALNVTVVDGEANDAGGYVTVYPCGTRPDSSNLNFVNGQTVPNAVIAPVSNDGHVCFYVYGKAHLLVDAAGYFSAPPV